MKKKWFLSFLVIYLFLGGIFIVFMISQLEEKPVDMVAVNRIIQDTKNSWKLKVFHKEKDYLYEYAILDVQGELLYRSSEQVFTTVHEAARNHYTIMDIEDGEQLLGKALIRTSHERELAGIRMQLMLYYLFLLFFFLIPVLMYFLYQSWRIQKPFIQLKDFAHHIAMGNLDVPLPMDQDHIFGVFTESFDIMREQLKQAKAREAAADKSKKELIASLSHDIKTPVTSIKLVSELLLATQPEGKIRDKIGIIYEKSGQIDRLITNLFQASLEELEEMAVNVSEESSTFLQSMIASADYHQKVHLGDIPGCILLMDSLRASQVIDNVIHNSYKYADTPITVYSNLIEDGLILEFKDYGKGVPDEELPYLFQKFYRGSIHSSEKSDGSGLGLYISRRLMEQMGGTINCHNDPDGFVVTLYFKLAI